MKFSLLTRFALLIVPLICAACGAGGGGTEVVSNAGLRTANIDTSDVLFEADSLVQVDIEMDPEEYDILRLEGRYLPQVFAGCWAGFEYTHFKATVTVAGEILADVDIRKKGFLGSLSASRPSFKLDFDTHHPGRRLESLERMTLNNNRQDPGNTHQCIAYSMFREAGLIAPRCNFARVRLNGEDLGIYSHVESVKNHFLRRNFDSDAGNLYEAQLGDFGEYTKENFQLKTNEDVNDRSDLDAVVAALQADDENLPGLLEQVVDIDAFLSFWAMESITGHWDSATGNANNYYVYREPESGLFYYIPWGADAAMELLHSLAPGSGPLFRYTAIPARLFQIPEYRDRYHARVLELLDAVWDETRLSAEIDRIGDLTGTSEQDLVQVRAFVSQQEARVRAAVAGDLPQTERTIVDQATVCNEGAITRISGSFTAGLGFFEYEDSNGEQITVPAFATPPSLDGPGSPLGNGVTINLIGNVDGVTHLSLLSIEEGEFGPGEIPFHGVATTLFLITIAGQELSGLTGLGGEGSIIFDEPPALGESPTMHFTADLWLSDGSSFGPFGGL